ncbi:MAG: hypothetical protein A2075_02315 [Geobacteraceae bacterium GWC2_58_44]|nr:MAG: hypothetical protein A2075_02315 [Geobacteraceae bacterium GWC2_58_44]
MCVNWKRFTFGAIMLASLSIFLFGCGDYGGTAETPGTKSITGVVSDPATALPVANATVTAYAIDANGVQSTVPLSVPATSSSDGNGKYALKIPQDYAGSLVVNATLPAAASKISAKNSKEMLLATTVRTIRAILPPVARDQTAIPPAMVSLATEMVVVYIEQNKGMNGFSSDNIRKATVVIEAFFGPNFAQTPPPRGGSAGTKVQQDLVVVIRAFSSILDSHLTTEMVKVDPGTGTIGLGAFAANLTAAVTAVREELINIGMLPGSYSAQMIITVISQAATTPVTEPDLADRTAPSPPADLAVASAPTAGSVALSWTASTDNVAVTRYYVYRDGIFIAAVSTPWFTDDTVSPATTYKYEVKARDAVANLSAGSTISIATPAPTSATYTISGKVSLNGTGLAGVFVIVTGSGSSIVVTDADGNYSFTGARNGSYTIMPSLTGYAFTPVSLAVSISNAGATEKDFTATQSGSVTGGVTYPDGIVIGGVTYPPGTIIGGVTYPTGVVIGGVAYPTATVVGGVTYPTGTVIGGITYPGGVIIGGVTYPPGTVVGGIAFPVGTVIGQVTYPTGTVIGGVIYPTGTVSGGVIYPGGTVIGQVTYPTGTVIGGVTYPNGVVIGSVSYPTVSITAAILYPTGSVTGVLTWPSL